MDNERTEIVLGCLNKGTRVIVHPRHKQKLKEFPDLKITFGYCYNY